MKVKIGKYLTWWGPYQIADLLFGNPEKYSLKETWRHRGAQKLGAWLAETKFADFCQWIHDRRKRQVYVHIDAYDAWNVDSTLNLIIGPLLTQLKATKHGYGWVEDADVPEHLRSDKAPAKANSWDWDANAEGRYEWVLDELIWVFTTDHDAEQHKFYDHGKKVPGEDLMQSIYRMKVDHEGLTAYQTRVSNAYLLFGKYYQSLWD